MSSPIVIRCVQCGLILRKRLDQESSSSGTAGGSGDHDRCLRCAVEWKNAPLPIEAVPIAPEVQDTTYLLRQIEREHHLHALRSYFMARPNYHIQSLEQILCSGSCLTPNLFHPYEHCPTRPVVLKSENLVESVNYLAYDVFLTLEFAKTVDAFRNLDLCEQLRQCKRVILPLALFTEAYLSRASGFEELTLPNHAMPLGIKHPQYSFRPISLYRSLCQAHKNVFSEFMVALNQINLTAEEYVLFKQLFITCTAEVFNAPSLNTQSKAILNANYNRYNFMIRRYLTKNYSQPEANRRYMLMSHIGSHFFKIAQRMKVLHQLVKQHHEKEKLPAAFLDEMM